MRSTSTDEDLPANPEAERAIRINALADLVDPQSIFTATPFQSQTIAQPWTFAMGASYSPFTLNRIALNYGYMSYGLVQDVIDMPVDDAFRGGLEIESDELDPDDIKELLKRMEEEGDWDAIKQTAKWARLFGGAGLIIGTDQNPKSPLRDLAEGAELKFIDADRWEVLLTTISISGTSLGIDHWKDAADAPYNYYGVTLNSTRVLRMLGKSAPSMVRARLQGWGMSELERCMREINSYIKFQNLLFELVDEAKIDVYGIEEFNESLATAKGTAEIQLRIQLSNWLKNYKNALVMDKEDTYEQKQIAFGGLADIFEEFRISLCAALKIPYNKLFGQSSTGFSSGEDSLENYNAMVDGEIREKLKPTIREVIKLRMQATFGFAPEFSFKFKPLRVLGAVEEEAVKTAKQTRTLELYDRDLLDGQESMESLHKDGLLNVDSDVLEGKREPISPLEMEQEAQEKGHEQGDAKLKIEDKKASKPAAAKKNALENRQRRRAAMDGIEQIRAWKAREASRMEKRRAA